MINLDLRSSGPLLLGYLFALSSMVTSLCSFGQEFLDARVSSRFTFHHENVLGSSLELHLEGLDADEAKRAETLALQTIDRLSELFSSYSKTSEFSDFCRLEIGESMVASSELCQLLKRCEAWQRVSEGAFQPAVELLSRRWKEGVEQARTPEPEELLQLAKRISKPHWRVELETNRLTRCSEEPLILNAIAKGTILDGVGEVLQKEFLDLKLATINIGGDIRIVGDQSQVVSIPDPRKDAIGASPAQRVVLHNQGIATSGVSERYYAIGNHRYSHLIDPRTGRTCDKTLSATVIAPDAETADVLATICCVLAPAQAIRLVDALPGCHAWIVTMIGDPWVSSDWPGQEPQEPVTKGALGKAEDKSEASPFDFLVEFEIAKSTEGGRYRRPYVAVWVEDKDGFPVKTLSLFLMAENPGPRWHRDLRRWYSSDQARMLVDETKLIGTISKPTRNPGNYKVAWDGRDDHGKLLTEGNYTLFIEAAREHGTYQLMKLPFEIGKADFEETLKGNVEIKAASMKYHKK